MKKTNDNKENNYDSMEKEKQPKKENVNINKNKKIFNNKIFNILLLILFILIGVLIFIQLKFINDRNCDCQYNAEFLYEQDYKKNFKKP